MSCHSIQVGYTDLMVSVSQYTFSTLVGRHFFLIAIEYDH